MSRCWYVSVSVSDCGMGGGGGGGQKGEQMLVC